MHDYDYRKETDLARLADDLMITRPVQRAHIVAEVLAADLMRAPLHFRFSIWLARMINLVFCRPQLNRTVQMALVLGEVQFTDFLDTMWSQTLHWMRHGLDATDPASAGGWSALELGVFLKICRRAGWEPEQQVDTTRRAD